MFEAARFHQVESMEKTHSALERGPEKDALKIEILALELAEFAPEYYDGQELNIGRDH